MGQDCKFCGAYISGRAEKCPACGKRISYKEEAKSSYSSGTAQAYAYAEPEKEPEKENKARQAESYSYTYNNSYDESADRGQTARQTKSPAAADQDAKDNQLISLLCYFGLLFLIPYLTKPNSEFVKFHSNQGLVLLIACIAYSIVYGILSWILLAISWRLYFITSIIGIVGIVFLVLAIIGIINAANGRVKELPVIGKFRLLK